MAASRECLGRNAEAMGLLAIDSERAAITYFVDLEDKKRIGIATLGARAILSRKECEALLQELPEILRMYGGKS